METESCSMSVMLFLWQLSGPHEYPYQIFVQYHILDPDTDPNPNPKLQWGVATYAAVNSDSAYRLTYGMFFFNLLNNNNNTYNSPFCLKKEKAIQCCATNRKSKNQMKVVQNGDTSRHHSWSCDNR